MRKNAEKITDIYLAVMLGLFPLFTGFSGYAAIAQSKWWFYFCVTGLWMLALLFARLHEGNAGQQQKLPLPLLLLAIFAAWSIFSAVCSPFGWKLCFWGTDYYDGFFPLLIYIATAMLLAHHGKLKPWHTRTFGISLFLCLLVAHRQLADANPLALYPSEWRFSDAGTLYSGMYLGTVGNTLILCSVLSLGLPWLFCAALQRRGWDWLLLLPVGMGLYVLYRCDGSSAWVALLVAAALALPAVTRGRHRKRILLAEALAVLCALVLLWFWPGQSGTLYEASQLLHGNADDSFGSSRVRIWRAAWNLVRERPWLGGGPGTFAQRIDVSFSRFVPETGGTLSTYVTNPHNEYLGLLVNLGIPGLALYVGSLGSLFSRGPVWKKDALPILLGFTSYAVQAFFALGYPLSAPLFWIAWGLLAHTLFPVED